MLFSVKLISFWMSTSYIAAIPRVFNLSWCFVAEAALFAYYLPLAIV